MPDYIFTTKAELMEIVKAAISEIIQTKEKQSPVIDTLDLDGTLELLAEHGYHTTRAQIYKFTSLKRIPYMKVGNKLLFSRKEIVEWLKKTSVRPKVKDNALRLIQKSIREC